MLRGRGVHPLCDVLLSHTLFAQGRFGGVRGEPLVNEPDRDVEAALEAPREAARQSGELVFAVVGRKRDADNQHDRMPLRDDRGNGREPAAIVLGAQRSERMRDPDLQIADRDTDALFAEVECENRAGPRGTGER